MEMEMERLAYVVRRYPSFSDGGIISSSLLQNEIILEAMEYTSYGLFSISGDVSPCIWVGM
eukprot:scaffold92094_cov55-Attheya_sp.AAC.3